MVAISQDGADVLLKVKAVPGASRTGVAGMIGERVKIALAAPPEKGQANDALTKLIAGLCRLRTRDVTVESGLTAPTKTVRIKGTTADHVRKALAVSES